MRNLDLEIQNQWEAEDPEGEIEFSNGAGNAFLNG